MSKPTYSRISITLPPEVLAEADRLAQEHERPRSWVIAEAIRGFGTPPSTVYAVRGRERSVVAEPPNNRGTVDLVATARRDHLRDDLRRTPAERLQRAQKLVGLARTVHPRPTRDRVIGFNHLEEFQSWKKAARAGG